MVSRDTRRWLSVCCAICSLIRGSDAAGIRTKWVRKQKTDRQCLALDVTVLVVNVSRERNEAGEIKSRGGEPSLQMRVLRFL
jgi:hypothetical protein